METFFLYVRITGVCIVYLPVISVDIVSLTDWFVSTVRYKRENKFCNNLWPRCKENCWLDDVWTIQTDEVLNTILLGRNYPHKYVAFLPPFSSQFLLRVPFEPNTYTFVQITGKFREKKYNDDIFILFAKLKSYLTIYRNISYGARMFIYFQQVILVYRRYICCSYNKRFPTMYT